MRSGAFRKSVNDLFISRGSVKLPSIRHKKKVKKIRGKTHTNHTHKYSTTTTSCVSRFQGKSQQVQFFPALFREVDLKISNMSTNYFFFSSKKRKWGRAHTITWTDVQFLLFCCRVLVKKRKYMKLLFCCLYVLQSEPPLLSYYSAHTVHLPH